MSRKFPQLREDVADAITYHPGNRTGTPEQRHPVSLMLADAVLRVVRPCTCDGDPIECSHEAARGQAEAELASLRGFFDAMTDQRDALKAVRRCPSCDHVGDLHQPDGCWYAVTTGGADRDLVCPCTMPRAPLDGRE